MSVMPFTIRLHKFVYYSLNIIITLIEFFLGFRVLLKALAANPSPFVNWIYATSDGMLDPFYGMFDNFVSSGGRVLEFSVLFAIAFYALMYYFFLQLLVLASDVIKRNNATPLKKSEADTQKKPTDNTVK